MPMQKKRCRDRQMKPGEGPARGAPADMMRIFQAVWFPVKAKDDYIVVKIGIT